MHSYLLSLFLQLSGAVNRKSNCINQLYFEISFSIREGKRVQLYIHTDRIV